MPAVYYHEHRITADDLDLLGHANNLAYLRWMQSAAVRYSAAQGWPTERYVEFGSGWVVRSHQIEYLQPAFLDQEIIVKTWVADMAKVTSLRRYHILRRTEKKEILLAKAATNWAFIHYKSGMPKRIPPEVATSFVVVPEIPVSESAAALEEAPKSQTLGLPPGA